jgi:hypothetical protein
MVMERKSISEIVAQVVTVSVVGDPTNSILLIALAPEQTKVVMVWFEENEKVETPDALGAVRVKLVKVFTPLIELPPTVVDVKDKLLYVFPPPAKLEPAVDILIVEVPALTVVVADAVKLPVKVMVEPFNVRVPAVAAKLDESVTEKLLALVLKVVPLKFITEAVSALPSVNVPTAINIEPSVFPPLISVALAAKLKPPV